MQILIKCLHEVHVGIEGCYYLKNVTLILLLFFFFSAILLSLTQLNDLTWKSLYDDRLTI